MRSSLSHESNVCKFATLTYKRKSKRKTTRKEWCPWWTKSSACTFDFFCCFWHAKCFYCVEENSRAFKWVKSYICPLLYHFATFNLWMRRWKFTNMHREYCDDVPMCEHLTCRTNNGMNARIYPFKHVSVMSV